MQKIEKLIPAALQAIDAELVSYDKYKNGIPKAYQGAVAGFGTTLLQMGLLPTLAVYADQEHQADIERDRLFRVLIRIVQSAESNFDDKGLLLLKPGDLLSKIAREKDNAYKNFPQAQFKEKLLEASLAFKLAIRTYKLV